MNRRDFLQTLTVAGVSVALPIKLVSEAIRDHKFTRRTRLVDYDSAMVLGVYAEAGGRRHALTKVVSDESWRDMTSAQREATWRRLEKLTLDYVSGRVAA